MGRSFMHAASFEAGISDASRARATEALLADEKFPGQLKFFENLQVGDQIQYKTGGGTVAEAIVNTEPGNIVMITVTKLISGTLSDGQEGTSFVADRTEVYPLENQNQSYPSLPQPGKLGNKA